MINPHLTEGDIMSDQNQDPPAAFGLLKPVDPNENQLGGAMPLTAPPPAGNLAAPAGNLAAPAMAPSMGTTQATVSQFQFQYLHGGKTYQATITHNSMTGYDIALDKWSGASWVPSASRLKFGLLSAFIVQQAATEALNSQMKKNKHLSKPPKTGMKPGPLKDAPAPEYTPDEDVPIAAKDGQQKQPVTG